MTNLPRRLLFRFRWQIIGAVVLLLVVWILFLDSHNIVQRVQWHQEHAQLVEENNALLEQIEELERGLGEPLSEEVIEQIAREQYGMRRSGEAVYPIEYE